jgi:hypothetical protein
MPDRASQFLLWSIAGILCFLPVWVQEHITKESRSVDFVYFYAVSQILQHMPAGAIYNPTILADTCQKIVPVADAASSYGPFQYPPYLALLLRPVALLPFWESFRIQQVVSLTLYLLGTIILLRVYFPRRPLLSNVFLPFAVAYLPWISNTWLNGQQSALGFIAVALALKEQEAGHLFRSGLALSLCLYKPTLLLLLIPMLLVRGQSRVIAGFGAGAVALTAAVSAAFGWETWAAYGRFLISASAIENVRQLPGYVDLTAFFCLLAGPHSGVLLALTCTAAALVCLMVIWRGRASNRLAWASAITGTLFLGPYVPLYDTILIIPSLIASGQYLHFKGNSALTPVLLVVFACGWLSAALATLIHVQLLTLALVLLFLFQLYVFCPSMKQNTRE